jgi:hypothetical protein
VFILTNVRATQFLVPHERPSCLLCRTLPPKGYSFALQQNSWNTDTSVVDLLPGMRLVPVGNPSSQKASTQECVLLQDDGTTPLAVLRLENYAKPNVKLQICAFPSKEMNATKSGGTYQGKPLVEWAVVSKRLESNLYDMTTADGTDFTTEFFGKAIASSWQLALKQQSRVCASLRLDKSNRKWKCRVGVGVDAAVVVCFLAGMDKLRESEADKLKSLHYSPKIDVKNVL